MRRKIKTKKPLPADLVYKSEKVSKFINYVMERGKKTVAQQVVYDAFELIKEKEKVENPIDVFETALKNTMPMMEVRSRRVGGANYQVPREVRSTRRDYLSMK